MNRFCVYMVTISIFFAASASAQYTNKENDESGAPTGMEVRKVNNDVSVLMPKGARMYNRNSTTYVEESADEYAARNVAQMNDRLKKLERENKMLAEEISYLRAQLIIPAPIPVPEKSDEEDASKPAEE